jgi:ubiquitin-protein ligase
MNSPSPRIRRLKLDHERLNSRFQDWNVVQICGFAGTPPEQYQITYALKGIYAAPNGQILERDQHTVEINLSLGYPRRAPHCKMLTPIFHPNFDETSVCIGDFWAASEGLDELIVRIGRMIAYQEYNTKSPLNGLAARWAEQHSHMLPVDSREVAPPLATKPLQDSEEKVVVELLQEEDELSETLPEAHLIIGQDQIPLGFGITTIGRSPESIIQIVDTSVSGNHAEILFEDAHFHLKDLHSTNGTSVNGERISQVILGHGDEVSFGKVEAVYVLA